jgi:peptidoglycan/LPS O-acetylase OafA/YrhL
MNLTVTRDSAVGRAEPGAQRVYSPEIDGLRAVAVIAVIINHLDKRLLPSGHLGVDIFFVISGYVITASLAKRGETSFVDLLAGFYVRRVKRLVPALAVSVFVTAVLVSLVNASPAASLKTGVAALFGASNVYLYLEATDYFGSSAALNVFTHTWSLGVEEQYYLTFPLVVWLTGLGRRANGLTIFAWAVGLSSVAALLLFMHLSKTNPAAAFYLMPARLWELGTGCLMYVLVARAGMAAAVLRRVSPLPLLLALVVALFVPARFPVLTTAAVVALTALLIVALRPGTLGYRALSNRGAVYVGQTSYSLYLWHWSVIALSHWTIGIHWWSVPLQCGLMLLLADRSYRHLERPLRSASWAPTRGRTIAYGFGASAAVALAVVVLANPLDGELYTGEPPRLAARGVTTLVDRYQVPGGAGEWRGEACVLSSDGQVGKTIPVEGCTLGDPGKATRRVLVVGDSFSAAYVAAFDDLVASDGYAVTVTSSWGASPAPNVENTSAWSQANAYYWADVVPKLESDLRPGDWVFAINDMSNFAPALQSSASDASLKSLEAALRAWSARLAERGVRLAFLHGNAFAREALCEPELAVRQWFAPFGGPCKFYSRSETVSRRQMLDSTLATLEKDGSIAVVDLLDVFCPGDTCTYDAKEGLVLYRDIYSHPSSEAARLSGPTIRRILTHAPERRSPHERATSRR